MLIKATKKIDRWTGEWPGMGCLDKVIRKDFLEEMTFVLRPKWQKGGQCCKDLKAKGRAECKGLIVRKASCMWATTGRRMRGSGLGEMSKSQSPRALQCRARGMDFTLSALGSSRRVDKIWFMILKCNFSYSVGNGLQRRARMEETGSYCSKTDEMMVA